MKNHCFTLGFGKTLLSVICILTLVLTLVMPSTVLFAEDLSVESVEAVNDSVVQSESVEENDTLNNHDTQNEEDPEFETDVDLPESVDKHINEPTTLLQPYAALDLMADHTINLSGSVGDGVGYTWSMTDKIIRFNTTANGNRYTLVQTGSTQNVLGIVVSTGVNTSITLNNVDLTTTNSPLQLLTTAELELILVGNNTLSATSGSSGNNGGVGVPFNALLTIRGSGSLKATGGNRGAGIGGTAGGSGGTITIIEGTIEATGGSYSAGIGGSDSGLAGTINIEGGVVTAIGGTSSAGIGGGEGRSGGTININSGIVTATGNSGGAGIGGGEGGSGGIGITINGGTVTATGSSGGAGIGGGEGGNGTSTNGIIINNGTVIATGSSAGAFMGGSSGAGIGGGDRGSGGTIIINCGTVSAKGGSLGGAGIGSGCRAASGNITISGGAVTATGPYGGAGIGGGYSGNGGNINIFGGNIIASGAYGAGIGGGRYGTGGSITVSNGIVTATESSGDGAGIGGGGGAAGGTTTIKGGTVTATAGESNLSRGAGIGGGNGSAGGTIIVEGSATVTAVGGGNGGAGIGGGSSKINDRATSIIIAGTANVVAYACSAATPAIDSYLGNQGSGHFVPAYLNTSYNSPVLLRVYADGGSTLTRTVQLPENYQSFAYTTGRTTAQYDYMYAYDSSAGSYMGRAERVYDLSPNVFSTLNASPTAIKLNPKSDVAPPSPVTRLAGANREATAALASQRAYPNTKPTSVVIASSANYPDALAASSLAGVINGPILLTTTSVLSQEARNELTRISPRTIYIVGGTASISAVAQSQISQALPSANIVRLGGSNRYETSELIANKVVELGGSSQQIFLVTGTNYPDALSASSVAAYKKIPIILTDSYTLSASAGSFIVNNQIKDVTILGGTAVVSQNVQNALGSLGVTTVLRASGADRYATALDFINKAVSKWQLNPTLVGVATGDNFPDALSGGPAIGNRGGLLVITKPNSLSTSASSPIEYFLGRVTSVEILGGTAVISTRVQTSIERLLV